MKTHIQPKKQRNTKKAVALLCAAMLLLACIPMIGGSLAYLADKTQSIVNAFVLGELGYELTFVENKPAIANSNVTGMPASQTWKVADVEYTFTTDSPVLTGYKFLGWADQATATEADYLVNETTGKTDVIVEYDPQKYTPATATTSKTVYAVWKQMDFKLSFDTQVKDMTNPASRTVTYDLPYGELPVLNREGYTFNGWALDKMGSTMVNDSTIVATASDHTLYAIWDAKTYVIQYHANGGTGTMGTQTARYDAMIVLAANEYKKNDYSFAGWSKTPNGEVDYIDKQEVVNLIESGTLDLYAVWIQDSHTVTFDYNLGSGVPPTKLVQYGKEYGVLPTYPTLTEKLFTGWYTQKEGGTRVYPETIVNRMDDHTLYAHWEGSPANDVIKELTVKNNPDDNGDGVADDIYLTFKCSSSFEKFNIPLKNLVVGQKYKISYTASNNASFGDYVDGYRNSVYGSYIVPDVSETGGLINDAVGEDIIATWNNRIEADGVNDGSHPATNDKWLQGPHKNRTITFTATKSQMYWTWDMGLMQDGILNEYNIMNIRLEPVVPEIKFSSKTVEKGDNSAAEVVSQTNGKYNTNFVFDGDGGCETLYYPITGLTMGTTYTIKFDHKISGAFVNSSNYDHGCGIMNKATDKAGSFMSNLVDTTNGVNWLSDTFVAKELNKTKSVTLTFTAESETAYWVWNMANCSDRTNCTIDVKVTSFSAKHAGGGSITYYTATSAASDEALTIVPPTRNAIDFTFDLSMDELMPFANDMPYQGEDFVMTFTPAEGYAMPEYVRVLIDGEEHLYISADLPKGIDVDGFECYVLTIAGELLKEAVTMYIEAIAETVGVTYVVDIPGVVVTGTENTNDGVDGVLTLTGSDLPDILTIQMKDVFNSDGSLRKKGAMYVIGTDENLVKAGIKAWEAEPRSEWLVTNEDGSVTITIPAGLMKAGEIITVSGKRYEAVSLFDFSIDDLQ